MEGSNMGAQNYNHLIFDKETKGTLAEKKVSSTNGSGSLDLHMQKNEIRSITIILHISQI